MVGAWYENEATADEKRYDEAVMKITSAVKQGVSFKEASKLVDIKDEALMAAVSVDALKVLIAEMHFAGDTPLRDVAKALKLNEKELEKAKKEMLSEVEAAAIEKYKSEIGQSGEA